jgi:glycosyltransferase involved in cell wall biosynthesis
LNIIIFSSIPWNFLWQRPQQIAFGLAKKGHSVIYFNGPLYMFNSLLKYRNEGNVLLNKKISKNLVVTNIFSTPFLGKAKFVTSKLGLLNFEMHLRSLNFKPDVAIFCSIYFDFLLKTLKSSGVYTIFDCLDDFSAFSNVPMPSVALNLERYMVENTSHVIATSKSLCLRISKIRSDCSYVPNAADFAHFNTATKIVETPHELKKIRHPVIGYIGAIFDWIDIDLICKLAKLHPEYSILLVGPIKFGLEEICKYSNIIIVGIKKYGILPNYLAHMDVCLIPFKINKLTEATNPIKLYEYLAAGKPVVSTALPEVYQNASDVVFIGENSDDFIEKVEIAVKEVKTKDEDMINRRVSFAENNSWIKRVQILEKLFKTEELQH